MCIMGRSSGRDPLRVDAASPDRSSSGSAPQITKPGTRNPEPETQNLRSKIRIPYPPPRLPDRPLQFRVRTPMPDTRKSVSRVMMKPESRNPYPEIQNPRLHTSQIMAQALNLSYGPMYIANMCCN